LTPRYAPGHRQSRFGKKQNNRDMARKEVTRDSRSQEERDRDTIENVNNHHYADISPLTLGNTEQKDKMGGKKDTKGGYRGHQRKGSKKSDPRQGKTHSCRTFRL